MDGNAFSIPEHYHKVQTMAQREVSDFWALQNTLSQISEQGKASCTPVTIQRRLEIDMR